MHVSSQPARHKFKEHKNETTRGKPDRQTMGPHIHRGGVGVPHNRLGAAVLSRRDVVCEVLVQPACIAQVGQFRHIQPDLILVLVCVCDAGMRNESIDRSNDEQAIPTTTTKKQYHQKKKRRTSTQNPERRSQKESPGERERKKRNQNGHTETAQEKTR